MTIEAKAGPVLAWGQMPVSGTQPPPDYNSERAPSPFDLGTALLDPRYGYNIGGSGGLGASGNGQLLAVGWLSASAVCIDQAPSAIAVANIAPAANAANGVAMTLVSVSGAGITVMAAPTTITQTGLVVPSGTLAIDLVPGVVLFGQQGSIAIADPAKSIARAVSITGVLGGTGGAFAVSGFDLYGNAQTETITAAAGAVTTNGKKGWKFIKSVTPQFTDAHTYSVGTTDIYELPLRADSLGYTSIYWSNAFVTATTFVAADTTSPATATTGSVRGTFTVPTASDGTKKLQVFIEPSVANLAALTAGSFVGLVGVVPA